MHLPGCPWASLPMIVRNKFILFISMRFVHFDSIIQESQIIGQILGLGKFYLPSCEAEIVI